MKPQTLAGRRFLPGSIRARARSLHIFQWKSQLSRRCPPNDGELGILAGDSLRAAADMGLASVAVTLAHRKGHFKQHLDANDVRSGEDQPWDLEPLLTPERPVVPLLIEGRTAAIRVWRSDVEGSRTS